MRFAKSHPDKRTVDGIVFRSVTEAEAYAGFRALERRGTISKLQYEPEFRFFVNDIYVGSYKPDFVFHDHDGKVKVIEVKGFKKSPKTGKLLPRVDRDFSLRRNLMLACFGLEVEVL